MVFKIHSAHIERNADTVMDSLFNYFPSLRSSLSCINLGTFPTPVDSLKGLCRDLNRKQLYCKRDDLSGELYGGNKVRKLELLLAHAQKMGATRIITSGAAGSNHALATALYSRQCGFKVTLMLVEQPPEQGIDRNLLADYAIGAEMYHDTTYTDHLHHLNVVTQHYTSVEKKAPYVIPPGGSSPIGVIGFVNAAFELYDQIRQGILPEPAAIYVAFGTMGTAAGLFLGLRALGMKSKLIAVRVVPANVANVEKFKTLFTAANSLLRSYDASFPLCTFDDNNFIINDDFLGDGYGIATDETYSAIAQLSASDTIELDPVYTGKCGAAFLKDASDESIKEQPLLYWHTKSSRIPSSSKLPVDFRSLPECFHHYFNRG
jgi:1-aminocyclopropane-1-carboxylate deaminase/D-cysteine desulfhydrase-like pyridoxal-dependent ACC family enzyme